MTKAQRTILLRAAEGDLIISNSVTGAAYWEGSGEAVDNRPFAALLGAGYLDNECDEHFGRRYTHSITAAGRESLGIVW